jgi:hypothetical protein
MQTYSNFVNLGKWYNSAGSLWSWWNIDNRQWFRKTTFNWTDINTTNASIPYWEYDVQMVFDFVNKTARLSLSWYADVTTAITDADITSVKNNINFISLWFFSDPNLTTTSYYRDIHILVEY